MEGNSAYHRGFVPYLLAAFLIGIVGGFATVLGPAFVRDVGISYSGVTWTALAQAMSTAAFAPVLGKLGDVLGRRATLLLGIAVFTLGNALTAVASNLAVMLAARFIVGLGTAAVAPVIMAYIVSEFPRDRVGKGFAQYMLVSSASVVFGPTLGSLVIASFGWRAMIWLCTAISAAVGLACLVLGRGERTGRKRLENFDGAGALLVPVFFSLVLCIPSFGQNLGWQSPAFLWVLGAGLVSLAALVFAERQAENPILPGGFMRRRAFLLSVLALFLTQGLMQANMTNTIVFVSHTHGEESLLSGYAVSVLYLGMALGALFLGPLADRHEPKKVLTGSLLLTGLGCALQLWFGERTNPILLMGTLGVLGLGLGGNGTIFMKVALSDLSPEQAGAATGTYGLFRDLAAPFGVAVFVPMFTNRIDGNIAAGMEKAAAAVSAIRTLAAAELICVAAGIIVVWLLPRVYRK